MRHSILLSAVILPLLSTGTYCAQCPAVERPSGSYSFTLATDGGVGYGEENTGAYLGVDISDVSRDRLEALKLKDVGPVAFQPIAKLRLAGADAVDVPGGDLHDATHFISRLGGDGVRRQIASRSAPRRALVNESSACR